MDPGLLVAWVGVAVAILTALYAVYKDYIDVPVVEMSFRPDRDIKVQTNTKSPDYAGLSKWLRIKVVNSHSRTIAKGCRAYVTGIRKILPGGRQDLFRNDCRELRWQHDHSEYPSGQNLLPKVNVWIDLAATFDDPASGLSVRTWPADFFLLEGGEFIFTVQLSGEGLESAPAIDVRVFWDGPGPGRWSSLRGEYGGVSAGT